ncbi:hypothetical protein ACHAW5_007831 [Stephanodiscus triporus]|uniref:RING-type domain-containing protein n=1 Tax=Stephanodiscus triporus TaxID=2934178 RepID=A0ABD3N8J3_9STRA
MVGIDASFDPNDPGRFHLISTRRVMEKLSLHANSNADEIGCRSDQGVGDGEGSGGMMMSISIDGDGSNGVGVNDDANTVQIRKMTTRFLQRATRRSLAHNADLSDVGKEPQQEHKLSSASISGVDDAVSNALLNMSLTCSNSVSRGFTSAAVPTLSRSSCGVGGAIITSALSASSSSSTGCPGVQSNNMDSIRESSFVFRDGRRRGDPNNRCLICLSDERTSTIVHGETGHIACCLACARILKARGDSCPVCRLPIDLVIQHFWADTVQQYVITKINSMVTKKN